MFLKRGIEKQTLLFSQQFYVTKRYVLSATTSANYTTTYHFLIIAYQEKKLNNERFE